MNWRSGLFRTWILAAISWAVYSIWAFAKGCFYFPDSWMPICNTGNLAGGIPIAGTLGAFDLSDWFRLVAWTVGPPLGALIGGLACFWVLRGFRQPANSN
jgi:hypothetical protein